MKDIMKLSENLSVCKKTEQFVEYLKLSNNQIEDLTKDTSFYHDLNYYGDEAWELIFIIRKMGVDVTGINFEDYFPPEFSNKGLLKSLFVSVTPFSKRRNSVKLNYKRFTLLMVDSAFRDGTFANAIQPD
ncbi:hypothetical protein DES40_1919 [Litorimonas taeanensis]|uniref:Uncharacterized protein n=1 Tax=Litorimonas taeanensis TaxID=568099 RepID=A0A420WDR2_9PROT|nr:DUF1493 family protein [Litorimonas taeanensis]RKQ69133.1 hypothetical protein DES40_1919 [Litorimonas taeanensis]